MGGDDAFSPISCTFSGYAALDICVTEGASRKWAYQNVIFGNGGFAHQPAAFYTELDRPSVFTNADAHGT